MMPSEIDNDPRASIVSISEIAGYALLVTAVWQGSGLVSELAAFVGLWLDEPNTGTAHADDV